MRGSKKFKEPNDLRRKDKTIMIFTKILNVKKLLYSTIVLLSFTACGNDDNGGGNGGATERNDNRNTAYTDNAATRIEVPHLQGGNSQFIVYRTNDNSFDKDGVNYCVEWDKDLKANRWSCYILTKKNISGSGSRWSGDYNISETSTNSSYFFDLSNLTLDDYWHYTDNKNGAEHCYIHAARGFDHGHICNSNDRTYSNAINKQTFYITNMQPQYSAFNGSQKVNGKNSGIWLTMENFIHNFANTNSNKFGKNDTLFICKGGTIDREDQILTRIDGKMIVPKYFYSAIVWKRTDLNVYSGIAFWFEHTNVNHGSDNLRGYAISISELEKKLGGKIDFFCNLPDKTERAVEETAATMDFGL